MTNHVRREFLGVALGAATVLAALALPAAAAEYEWKWQSYWQPNTVNQKAFERFAENVEQKSAGES